jgi:hypothetical protein
VKYHVQEPMYWAISLDGHPVHYAQTADDEAGTATAPLVSADGKPVFDHGREDFAIVERAGKVEIKQIFDPPPVNAVATVPDDNPFRVEKAREGELSLDWHRVRFAVSP